VIEGIKDFLSKPLWKNSRMTYGYVIFTIVLWGTLMKLKYGEFKIQIIFKGVIGAIILVYLIDKIIGLINKNLYR